jgi:hypothetical protein
MNQHDLNRVIENHIKWVQGAEGGERANFRGKYLCGLSFRGARLPGADFSGSILTGVDMSHAIMTGSTMSCANMAKATLIGANLSRANMRDAILRCAVLIDSDTGGADISGADLWSTVGNNREIKTINTELWDIVYTDSLMQIGCHQHRIESWLEFSYSKVDQIGKDMVGWIKEYEPDFWLSFNDRQLSMIDRGMAAWWRKWKPILSLILEREL